VVKEEKQEDVEGGAASASTTPARPATWTRVFVLNLKKVDGDFELDWESEPGNILIRSRAARFRSNQMCDDVSTRRHSAPWPCRLRGRQRLKLEWGSLDARV